MDTFLCSFVQSCCGEGGTLQTSNTGVYSVSQPHWICPRSRRVCFPCLHCSGSRLLCWELSEADPGLCALPRSKPLRLRFSGTPQRCRLCWACALCPFQVRAAQLTRCLASAVTPSWRLRLITSPIPAARFPGCTGDSAVSGVPCVSSGGLTYDCDSPGGCKLSRVRGRLG